MAEDRADDIGSQFPSDADDSAPLSPVRNRAQVNYSLLPKKLGISIRQSQVQPAIAAQVIQGQLIAVSGDYYLLEDANGALFSAAKPWHLRQSSFDGLSILSKTYEYLSPTVRKVTDLISGDWSIEEVTPPYIAGTELMYSMPVDVTEVDNANDYIEMNLNGHQWVPAPLKKAIVMEVLEDLLRCKLLDSNELPTGNDIYVAKPWELRVSTYNGLTVNGITYAYTGVQQRSATPSGEDTESQVIVPTYVVEQTVIFYCSLVDGVELAVGTDVNVGARAWALDREA